ncbi:class I adenylate-forming enzyme family protein, partial [Desulfovirgula thermocuniculi]|uniref:class I adenylate-forming enzyme family protein n=1 Tax=Desulfovirgula thermocuniculi TaxID=348842 RepID=UPI0004289668
MAEFIHGLLERNARKYSFDEAVKWPEKGVSLTWDELNKRASSLAYQLKNRGIKPGDRVALFMPNRPEFVIGFFGVLKTGAVVVPVNARFTASEVSYILENSGAAALLYDDGLRPVAEDAVKSCSSVAFTFSAGEIWACGKEESFFSASVHANPAEILAEIIYTSGTTGKPKGVMLTHAAVYAVASMMAYECNIKYRNRVLQLMPLTHSAPLNLLLVGAVYAGAATVLGTFSPQNMVELAAIEKTTHFFGAPVAYLLAAKLPNFDQYDLSGERLWIYGGAPMSREAVIQVMQRFGGRFMGVYGLTEAGPNGSALFPHEHPDFAGSIGSRATVNAEIRIVDGEGRDVPCGEVGEVIIRTPSNMIGYYRNEEATQETLKDLSLTPKL